MTPEHAEHALARHARRVWVGLLVVVLATISAAVAYTAHGVGQANARADRADADRLRDRAASSRDRAASSQDITTLRAQVRALGGTPAVTGPKPEGGVDVSEVVRDVLAALPVPRDGRDGEPGPPPSDAQVRAAVTTVCARAGCGPSDVQVATQVAAYLAAHPPAAGRDGASGKDGTDGANGKDGHDGKDGRDGAPGIGIATISGVQQDGPNCTITITLTDSTRRDLTWTCQPTATATPTPTTPTPTGARR